MPNLAHLDSAETISPRQHIMAILVLIFFAAVLFSRFSLPPKSWRRLDGSMTMQELRAKLGEPFATEAGGTVWREEALLGYWELTVRPGNKSRHSFQNHFQFYREAEKSNSISISDDAVKATPAGEEHSAERTREEALERLA